ncbi:hypothetical protein GCM10018793_52750 [Streptomyces sulfonofaciens]|uniref:Uncharacterized protein n=1 Tax=Streptomyces sulfonofaciens TaxID=68272 RepID=A0A919GIJ0_9ACTN|nr:hypothetical protein GCM10018793_52750 [Streptomyces sulfonofaciens]
MARHPAVARRPEAARRRERPGGRQHRAALGAVLSTQRTERLEHLKRTESHLWPTAGVPDGTRRTLPGGKPRAPLHGSDPPASPRDEPYEPYEPAYGLTAYGMSPCSVRYCNWARTESSAAGHRERSTSA